MNRIRPVGAVGAYRCAPGPADVPPRVGALVAGGVRSEAPQPVAGREEALLPATGRTAVRPYDPL